jgi:D-alanyl-D-alanine carboxypeptidase
VHPIISPTNRPHATIVKSVMKNARVHLVLIVTAFVVVVAVVSFAARSSRGQSTSRKKESTVKRTVLMTDRTSSTGTKATPTFAEAAAESNAILRNELDWAFGGKPQRGWYLYDLLIEQTLQTQDDSDTPDFAASLADWQKKRGLSSNGVLDEDALMAMVSQWQSTRLKDRTPAQYDQMLTAPASDFYDPERLAELRFVERKTYTAYKEMVAAAITDPSLKLAHTAKDQLATTEKYFKIISAFRSPEYQEQLRRQSPNAGTAGLAVNSPHFTGRALDLYVGGDPVDTRDSNRAIQVNTPAYKWLVRNAERFGFRPYFYEPWHWEYVK